jgi:ATP-dependent protease ClpP protease subunit
MTQQQPPVPALAPHFVNFSAEINASTSEALIAMMSQLANQGVQDVTLMLTTVGGTVMHGMALYNVLRAMPFKLTTHNTGSVNSIGNAVFLAGDVRRACPHSTFMFHGVGFDLNGQVRLEEKLLRERLDGIVADQKQIGAVIEERTKLGPGEVGALFLEAQTKDAEYAVSTGIVDEISDIKIPAGSPVLSLVFNR